MNWSCDTSIEDVGNAIRGSTEIITDGGGGVDDWQGHIVGGGAHPCFVQILRRIVYILIKCCN